MTDSKEPSRLLTKKEVAARLGVSELTVHRMIKRSDLDTIKIGRSVRIRPEDVQNVISPWRLGADHPITFQAILLARQLGPEALNEASLARVVHFAQSSGARSFGILVVGDLSCSADNRQKRLQKLHQKLEGRGLGFAKLVAHGHDVWLPAVFVGGVDLPLVQRLVKEVSPAVAVYSGPETKHLVHLVAGDAEPTKVGPFAPASVARALTTALVYPVTFEYPAQTWIEAMMEMAQARTGGAPSPSDDDG